MVFGKPPVLTEIVTMRLLSLIRSNPELGLIVTMRWLSLTSICSLGHKVSPAGMEGPELGSLLTVCPLPKNLLKLEPCLSSFKQTLLSDYTKGYVSWLGDACSL